MTRPSPAGKTTARARAPWKVLIEAGSVSCLRCGQTIAPWQSWDLDHLHPLVLGGALDGPAFPAHEHCNRSHGARLGARLRGRPKVLERDLKMAIAKRRRLR